MMFNSSMTILVDLVVGRPVLRKIVAEYNYVDADGVLLRLA